MPSPRIRALLLFAAAGWPVCAAAQPIELLRTEHDSATMRAQGLGGALVGLADDVSASGANPAGLAALPRALDASAGLGWPRSRGTPGYFGFAVRPSRLFGVSFRTGRSPRETLYGSRKVDETAFNPTAAGRFAGFAGGLRLARRASAGVSLVWQSLAVSAAPRPGEPSAQVTHHDSSWSFSAGILFRPDEAKAPSLGLAYRHRLEVEATSVPHGPVGPTEIITIKTPRVFSAGVSWYYDFRSTRALFTYQQDLVRFSEFPGSHGERGPDDDFDFRLGTELTFPLRRHDCHSGCGNMVQLRGAIVSRAPLPINEIGPSARAQREDRRKTTGAAGFSVAPPRLLTGRLKFEGSYANWSETYLLGISFRYPRAFRGDQTSGARGDK
jgi:hypothetical protein